MYISSLIEKKLFCLFWDEADFYLGISRRYLHEEAVLGAPRDYPEVLGNLDGVQ